MNDWYFTKDDRRRARQVVVEAPAGGSRDSEFGKLLLNAKYQNLTGQTWTAGYFRTDSKMGPYLMVRAGDHIERLRDCPLRLAFSFYREASAGLFGIFVAADSVPELQQASPTGHALVEGIYGLDVDDTVQRIRDALAAEIAHLCFADGSSNMPCCLFDRVIQIPEECRVTLVQQFRELLAYHTRTRRDYQRAMQELSNDFSAREHPILGRISSGQAAGKRWWEFWR